MAENAADTDKTPLKEKKTLDARIALALMIVMVFCALCIGANKAWKQNRQGVDASYAAYQENIQQRVETAYNVLTVAGRYLPDENDLVSAVRSDLRIMEDTSGKTDLNARAAAASGFAQDAAALLQTLSQDGAVKQDARDQMYVTLMLPQAVEQCCSDAAAEAYYAAAASFNDGMHSFSGLLARLTGVDYAKVITVSTTGASVQTAAQEGN